MSAQQTSPRQVMARRKRSRRSPPSAPAGRFAVCLHKQRAAGGRVRRPGGGEVGIGRRVMLAVCPCELRDLPPRGGVRHPRAALAHVQIAARDAEERRVEDMRRGAVGIAHAERGDVHAVERVRVAGAEDVLHVVAGPLRRRADAPHEGGLARAGPALYHAQVVPLAGAEAAVERIKAGIGVCAQKIAGDELLFHGRTSFFHSIHVCAPAED